jgi:hypothetical protein
MQIISRIKKNSYREIIILRQRRKLSQIGTCHVMLRGNEEKSLFPEEEGYRKFLQVLATKDRMIFLKIRINIIGMI